MLLTERRELVGPGASGQFLPTALPVPNPHPYSTGDHAGLTTGWSTSLVEPLAGEAAIRNLNLPILQPAPKTHPQAVDPLYLMACCLEWEQSEESSAAWELIAAARSSHSESRAHARALIAGSRHMAGLGSCSGRTTRKKRPAAMETEDMDAPYGLDIIDNCSECTNMNPGFFCSFSDSTLQALSEVSHKSVLPAGAILFVEGQSPRGLFILCSGKVNLSTTSLEGKTLIFKTAEDGAALGVSATISGKGYEATAVTASPCQVSFIDRKHFLELMETYSEVGMHTAQCLSRDFHSAYRDIHDLVLTRSSKGKLARLLLAFSEDEEESESRVEAIMTHEEIAQRIGASRETVTRLLGTMRKKRLIRLDGPTLVIRDRSGLKALAT